MEESPTKRALRHEAHQSLMDWQKLYKQLRRDRHHQRWHKRNVIPIQLI